MQAEPFHKYSINYRIGLGAYGEVYCATRSEDGGKFALKCFKDVFSKRGHTKSVLRELLFGRLIRHANVMHIEEILVPADISNFSAVWVVYEKFDEDLKRWSQRARPPAVALKRIFRQALRGLCFLHRCGVMHRDIKPDNILVNLADLHCVLADFNLSCLSHESRIYTEYTVTRWYRAPELLLGLQYSDAVDLWALGCTLGELLLGQVLFKGRNSREQLERIAQALGPPPSPRRLPPLAALGRPGAAGQGFNPDDLPEAAAEGGGATTLVGLCSTLEDESARDLLQRLLCWEPGKRLSAEKALAHPFFAPPLASSDRAESETVESECEPEPEPEQASVAALSFGFDEARLSDEDMRQKLVQEIQFYHPKYYKLSPSPPSSPPPPSPLFSPSSFSTLPSST